MTNGSSAPFTTAIGIVRDFDQLPLIGARTGSTSREQSASGYPIGSNESHFQIWRERLVKYRVSEALDVPIGPFGLSGKFEMRRRSKSFRKRVWTNRRGSDQD